jgi:His/Glu/Gln/Arg/opine family amino acid ABC transporter permease subunit
MASAEDVRLRVKRRKWIIQGSLLVVTILAIWGGVTNAQYNLTRLNMTSGFAFLDRGTGWNFSFSLIERSLNDTYARTLMIGLMNTLFVGFTCIVTTTVIGFIVGTMRDAAHPALRLISNVYVQIFRNIPLILQVIFLYAILIHMGGPRQAVSLWDMFFLSGRGLMMPGLNVSATIAVCLLLASVALAIALLLSRHTLWRGLGIWLAGTVVMALIAALVFRPDGEGIFSIPTLAGLRFSGGISVSIELFALLVSITLYGSAYIAEIVRGGLAQVPRGLVEAGQALGMTRASIWSRIKVPMALRSIIPPLGNQWIFMMKATTIGIAIGFSDLFYITVNSISQSGQTLELILMLMLIFLAINYSIALFTNWLNARLQLVEN